MDRPEDAARAMGGVRVTSPIRTVIDCARLPGSDWGVEVADAALRTSLVTVDELAAACARVALVTGSGRARALPTLVSPLAESPGESLLRLRRMGVEVQEQVVLTDVPGLPRVDFLVDGRLVVESDGQAKYGTGGDVERAHWRETQRHDSIVEAGYSALHVVWARVWDVPTLRARVERALRRMSRPAA